MHVLIVGAGTGGLALAHALKGAGVAVAVYERDITPKEAQGGYRVGISPAGCRALKACVPADVYDLFVATSARPPHYFNMLDERLTELLSFKLGEAATDAVDGEKNVVRKTLRRVLLTGLHKDVSFGKSFARYVDNADGSVTAHFEDGSSATGDVLVGADGSGSRVRKQRLPEARLEDTGFQQLIRLTAPSMVSFIGVRTSVPIPPWASSNVTLLGDAIHTMTPGRGAGANTALRDAALLSRELIEVAQGRQGLLQAVGAYETEMVRYSSEAVAESKKQMNANDAIHKPFIGRLQLIAMRGAMRTLNAVPPLKKRVLRNIQRVRGGN